jgi:hypothetical protein
MGRLKSLLLALLAFGMLECSGNDEHLPARPAAFDTRLVPSVQSFSLALAGGSLDLVFADRNSLVLAKVEILPAPSSNPPFSLGTLTFLDRISDMPGDDPLFGAQLFFTQATDRHLLYLGRAADESMLLKHIHWQQNAGNATIDALPFAGRPLAAMPGDDGTLELYFENGGMLCRQPLKPGAAAETLLGSFGPARSASMLADERLQAFTVFDLQSQRLILFRKNGRSLDPTVVCPFGAVHFSAMSPDGKAMILAYDQPKKRIVLFQENQSGAGFNARPVTVANEVSCLGMFFYDGMPFFLYSERVGPRSGRALYQLSLLIPRSAALERLSYRRQILQSGASPIPCFRAVASSDRLYLALLQGSVRFLRMNLRDYLRSESD